MTLEYEPPRRPDMHEQLTKIREYARAYELHYAQYPLPTPAMVPAQIREYVSVYPAFGHVSIGERQDIHFLGSVRTTEESWDGLAKISVPYEGREFRIGMTVSTMISTELIDRDLNDFVVHMIGFSFVSRARDQVVREWRLMYNETIGVSHVYDIRPQISGSDSRWVAEVTREGVFVPQSRFVSDVLTPTNISAISVCGIRQAIEFSGELHTGTIASERRMFALLCEQMPKEL